MAAPGAACSGPARSEILMDDTEKPPAPPRPEEVEELQAQSLPPAEPLQDTETRPPVRGGAPSASALPPPEDPSMGRYTPPPPGDTTVATNIQTTEMTPGVARSLETTNLD